MPVLGWHLYTVCVMLSHLTIFSGNSAISASDSWCVSTAWGHELV